jgi:hypothetical protein
VPPVSGTQFSTSAARKAVVVVERLEAWMQAGRSGGVPVGQSVAI